MYGNSASDADYMFEWCRASERYRFTCRSSSPASFARCSTHLRAGTLPEQVKIQLYFGGAAPFGLPPTGASLDAYTAMLDGTGLPWMVGVIGGDVFAEGFAAAAIERGGHVRVGLEDFLGPTRPRNEALVTAAVELVRDLGAEVATTEQTRELLVRR